MEKWILMLMILFLNILSPCNAVPKAEADPNAEANPDIILQVNQIVGEIDRYDPWSCSHWSYPSTNWPSICPKYCSGDHQSPIDIDTSTLSYASELFIPIGYFDIVDFVNIENNGHTVIITWDTSAYTFTASGAGLDGNYTMFQITFHWGCDNSRGSEHTVDGHRYAMESHFFHYKTSYGSLEKAIKHSDGLFIGAVFYNVGAENVAFKPITDHLLQITTAGADADIFYNEMFADFIPFTFDNCYRYHGSLTTPSCNQVVDWAVVKEADELSQSQLDAFRLLEDHEGNHLCDNYREVQPRNGRTVTEYNQL